MAQLNETIVQVVACRYSTFIRKGYGQSQYLKSFARFRTIAIKLSPLVVFSMD